MRKIEVENYRGISQRLTLDLTDQQRNLCIYGDNGSGKTSLFDAIRLWYFRDRLIPQDRFNNVTTPEDIARTYSGWLLEQECTFSSRMRIAIDDVEVELGNGFAPPVKAFMIKGSRLSHVNDIQLSELINAKTCSQDPSISETDESQNLVRRVTATLQSYFEETIEVSLSTNNPNQIALKDSSRNLTERATQLHLNFNEARIRLVRLLLFLEYALMTIEADEAEGIVAMTADRPLLGLDDVITSLDAANRISLLRYLVERFAGFQMLIFTHNASYFNLVSHVVDTLSDQNKWVFQQLICSDLTVYNYNYHTEQKVKDVRDYYSGHRADINGVANKLRQCFEVLVHQLGQLTLTDSRSESEDILGRILAGRAVYFKKVTERNKAKYLKAQDLLEELQGLLTNNPAPTTQQLVDKIAEYDVSRNIALIRDVLRRAKLYRKVILHQGSHGHVGAVTITTAEIEAAFNILESLEAIVKELRRQNQTYTI